MRRRRWILTGDREKDESGSTAADMAKATRKVAQSLISPVTQMQGAK